MATTTIGALTADTAPPDTSILVTETAAGATRRSTIRQLLDTQVATTANKGTVKKATAITALAQTISAVPTQAEVQAISTKFDALLAALQTAGVVS